MPSSSRPSARAEPAATAALRSEIHAVIRARGGWLARRAGPAALSRLGGLETLLALHGELAGCPPRAFSAAVLERLGIGWRLTRGGAEAISEAGPLLVVCNHPTGGAEALICHALIDARRADRRNLGLAAIGRIPELSQAQIGTGAPGASANARALAAAVRHLRRGGCLLAFPAGTVAHARLPSLTVREAPWHPAIARIAEIADAPVLPVHVALRASLTWRVASAVSRPARTLLLACELLNQRGAIADVALGEIARDSVARARVFAGRDR